MLSQIVLRGTRLWARAGDRGGFGEERSESGPVGSGTHGEAPRGSLVSPSSHTSRCSALSRAAARPLVASRSECRVAPVRAPGLPRDGLLRQEAGGSEHRHAPVRKLSLAQPVDLELVLAL